jgi:hypothetical protein
MPGAAFAKCLAIFLRSFLRQGFQAGMFDKNITIVNDASRVVYEFFHDLEHHLQLSIML